MLNSSKSSERNAVASLCMVVFSVLCICLSGLPTPLHAQQSSSYDLSFAPDLWYNSVDGIRVGIRMRGKVPGTFHQGPHRLDAGLWLATFFPDFPVSYYVQYTEPIPAISSFNSEGNIQIRSSIRTGYHWHQISLNKRWQPGFKAKNYYHLSVYMSARRRFDDSYRLYPKIWQNEWLWIAGTSFSIHNKNMLGRYNIRVEALANVAGSYPSFTVGRLTIEQLVPLGDYFSLRGRLFVGVSSENTAPEYRFTHSFSPYVNWMNDGKTRAKGTIPEAWMTGGLIHVSGGANLRGYTNYDIENLNEPGAARLYTSAVAFNFELDYPNPVDEALEKLPVVGGLLDFRTYLFFDTGIFINSNEWLGDTQPEGRWIADAGPGFALSLKIPDYLGKVRGFVLRYEMPLWLSHPQPGVDNFALRHVIGIGAVISL